MQSLAELHRDTARARSRSEQRSHYRAAMTVVSAHVGVGDDARFKVVRILPREIQRGRKGVGDVAGGTDALADDHFIRLARPVLGGAQGKPVAARLGACHRCGVCDRPR